MISEPFWLDPDMVIAAHNENLQRFGGPEGIRDITMLESALGRPINKHAYASEFDLAGLAAAYAFGIARNHPFVDGNKRAAYIAMEVFLIINGFDLELDESDAIVTFLTLAAGELSEDKLATWIRDHMVPRQT
jgi:death on curing protein